MWEEVAGTRGDSEIVNGNFSNIETAPKSRYVSRHDSIGGSCGGFGGAFIYR